MFFPHRLGIIIPIDYHIFQRGRAHPPTRFVVLPLRYGMKPSVFSGPDMVRPQDDPRGSSHYTIDGTPSVPTARRGVPDFETYLLVMKLGWLENPPCMEVSTEKSVLNGPCSIAVFDYRKVNPIQNPMKNHHVPRFSYGFPMVFLWFTCGLAHGSGPI